MERNFPIHCADFDRLVTDSVDGVRVEVSGMPDLSDPCLYADREYSWLQFNDRVLEEALDERNPLLERVKFLSIFGSNLDEFFMVRVSGVKKRITEGAKEDRADELAQEQLQVIREELLKQLPLKDSCWNEVLEPALREKGIKVLNYFELSGEDREKLRDYFERNIFPLLTPLGFDSGHPFPHISNLSLNLAVLIDDLEYGERFARVKIPPLFTRLIVVPEEGQEKIISSFEELKSGRFVWLEQLIAANLDLLFPGQRILGAYPFRITRDADLGFDEDGDKDLLTAVKQRVGRNYFGPAVRLETDYTMPERVSDILLKNLELTPPLMFRAAAPLGLSSLMKLTQINRPELKYEPFEQRKHSSLANKENIFTALKKKDVLLYHPYDSFESVTDLVEEAADDPDVLAIKMTLYRVDDNSRIIQALMKAADRNKQVAVLVELKARFDEENNIGWAKELERKGVHVAYGFPGRKTHAKMCLIVRAETEGIRYYVHMSTGNYNAVTGRLYTDFGYLTSDPFIGKDVSDLFNALTGYSRKDHYIKLLVAPQNMRHQILERIRREIDLHEKFGDGHLLFKMNSLVDYQCIRELYRASLVGVKVDLIVRGICCLRPGIYGLSENIRVTSIVGRFLEHSRVYYFRNGGKEEIFMGSADLMPRNLDNRVEVLFPVSSDYIPIMRDVILGTHLKDNIKARLLLPNGRTERIYPQPDEEELDSQLWMLENRGIWELKTENG
ncbi:polyphosphate kinase [Methanosarcina sp. 2.H.T.1A.6]|uniref:polyphosphate kinase 1 n=1 Tax=unclassified Methanosarcina TaxID=2644672 RepID=UPI0006215220|nr:MULTISPECIES: polyphosphate kinase 1 [unclassified Methanosarcina]KKG17300.1 polyphosphate kinase [Methanosarcina sp. 2.H.T.1A.3]KKG20499.1 polyphosphate kinase [Methanosarcina sp. 2.H.T.1A.6]KKG21350.1 polyphosphate kinase [Methanosarcina sp. 2.H.T.1A.8]KKG24720.1 polyphosphate kinase [Methanosarcina sp. 2.H.T.1A.15]